MEHAKVFLEYIIKSIVNNPDDVQVTATQDELGVLLSVKVLKEDTGIIIGRQGETAKAIRSLSRIVGIREKARVNVRIEEPEGSDHNRGTGNLDVREFGV